MSSITIRKFDDSMKGKLRIRAACHGRSMEEEARVILRSALASEEGGQMNLAERIRKRFAPLGGVELEVPPREGLRQPPDFGE
ncbi:MAG: plasmid stabilization protein [Alphaproteobacteria bacterium]|nr:plasmid stabilization protein [Alphaproteobacteria bacterium]